MSTYSLEFCWFSSAKMPLHQLEFTRSRELPTYTTWMQFIFSSKCHFMRFHVKQFGPRRFFHFIWACTAKYTDLYIEFRLALGISVSCIPFTLCTLLLSLTMSCCTHIRVFFQPNRFDSYRLVRSCSHAWFMCRKVVCACTYATNTTRVRLI